MSEAIKHECGIALIRLLKPLSYYMEKYGTAYYGLNRLCLLMEKQHNRGQDGAGIAGIKLDVTPGHRYISLQRSNAVNPIKEVFKKVNRENSKAIKKKKHKAGDIKWLKKNTRFCSELLLGHLRYGTFGKNSIESCHPFLRENNWMSRNLVLAGNFNLTNIDELFEILIQIGQHPKDKSDTVTILEKIGHFLDEENDELVRKYKSEGYSKYEISSLIAEKLDIGKILRKSCKNWDGGFVIAGLLGHGDAFVLRDPSGIRPAYYYRDEEVAVVASERPVIQTTFKAPYTEVRELKPGHALIIKKDGRMAEERYSPETEIKPCSFERIYFSRGTDADIYRERKKLGALLTPEVLKHIDYDLENTVFSFIPNTAETCFLGMQEELKKYCNGIQHEKILSTKDKITDSELKAILEFRPRFEKIAVKDAKLRTFITQDKQRDDLVAHVYDITYESIKKETDSLVVIDDSIVRGTTLKQSILRILDRLEPKEIILLSSAPQIRYPDCYGIDMAKLGDFVAFKAAVQLLKENGNEALLKEVYDKCKAQEALPKEQMTNCVKEIYNPFTAEQISRKISKLLTPPDNKAKVHIIYQSIENLHKACPDHKGDWYFTGDYPTPGGIKVVNKSFMNFFEGKNKRAY
jgi:amidophosphoribosyltransferase